MANDANYVVDGFIARGFTPVQAAVLAGNMQQESGFNPAAHNPKEDAFGGFQWRLDRKSGLENYAAATGRKPDDLDAQMDWVVKEMLGPESRNAAAFLAATDTQSANAAIKKYIRWGDNSDGARLQNALAFMGEQPQQAPVPALDAIAQATAGGNAGNMLTGDDGQFVNPAFGNSPFQMPGTVQTAPAAPVAPVQAPIAPVTPLDPATLPDPMAAATPASAPAASVAPAALSDDDLLGQFLPAAQASPASPAAQAPAAAPLPVPGTGSDDELLSQWLAPAAQGATAAPAVQQPTATQSLDLPVPGPDGGFDTRYQIPDRGKPTETYQPSSVPWLDPVSTFANAAVDAIPVVGPKLTEIGQGFDAGINNLLTGQNQTEADRAAINAADQAQYPGAATAGSIAGTVAPFIAAGATPIGARLLGMSGSVPARIGLGALSSAAISGGDTLARGGSLDDAKKNALIGGGIGAAFPLAGKAVGALKDAFLGSPAAKAFAAAMTADQLAPGAANRLMQAAGPGAVAADLGPNMQHLAGGLAMAPGEAQKIVVNNLSSRAANTSNRLTGDVASILGEGAPISAVIGPIVAAQKAAAAPLYEAVRPMAIEMTPALQQLQSTPMGKAAFERAAQMAANDGMSGAGTTVGFMDYVKQSLDDAYGVASRSGENNVARQAASMAKTLTAEIDSQVPQYAAARDAFAGPAKVLDAVDAGQSVFTRKMSPDELRQAMASMSSSEKDGLLQGVQAAVHEMIGNARTDAAGVKALFASSAAKEKLAMLLGQDAADALEAALAREATFARTTNVAMGNSETAARTAQHAAIDPTAPGIPRLTNQSSLGILLSGIDKARLALTAKYRAAQNVKLANLLTDGALSAAQTQAVGIPPNALIAPATPALLASPDNRNLLQGRPRQPLRITVEGANIIGQ